MNNTCTNLAAVAWSKQESLSCLRKFLQGELEHSQVLPRENFEAAIHYIDGFSTEISSFIQLSNHEIGANDLEEEFDSLSSRYHSLMSDLERLVLP